MYGDKAKALRFMPISVLAEIPINTAGSLIDADELETPHKYSFNEKMIRICDDPDSGIYTEGDMMVAWILYLKDIESLIEIDNPESFKQACFSAAILRMSHQVSKTISEPLQYGQVARNLIRYWNNFDDYTGGLKVGRTDPITQAENITKFIKNFCDEVENDLRNTIKTSFEKNTQKLSDEVIVSANPQVLDSYGIRSSVTLNKQQEAAMAEMMGQYRKSAESQKAEFVDSSDEMIPEEIRIKMLDGIEHFDVKEDINNVEFGETEKLLNQCPECKSEYVIYSGLGQIFCMKCDHVWNVKINTTEITSEMETEYQERLRERKKIMENSHLSNNPKSIKRIKKDNDT